MNKASEKVLHYLTGNKNLDAVTVDDLQKLVAESPYFPVSHFLLAKKLKGENEREYQLQIQKTALYFPNPYWLQYQLTGQEFVQENSPTALSDTTFISDKIVALGALEDQPIVEAPIDEATSKNEETPPEAVPQAAEEIASLTRSPNEVTESFISDLSAVIPTTDTPAESIQDGLSPAAQSEVTEQEEEMAGVTHGSDDVTKKFLEETGNGTEKDEQEPDDEHDRMFRNIKAMLDASSEEADADVNNATITIDPYYTIDYFASQGIKLELDQNPQDQLGQNLKKFTHWLRHMKKLGPEDATEVISKTETDADIQQIADSSNTVREVVTEAMASVLEKQGKKDKAIELYNKLSFLNPHKSAYFADKIKKLKGI